MDFGLLYQNDKREYEVLNDVRIADIRLACLLACLRWHVLRAYCTFASKQAVPLLYLGHTQIIIHSVIQSKGLLGGHKQTGRRNGRLKLTILRLTYHEQKTKIPCSFCTFETMVNFWLLTTGNKIFRW